MLSYQTFQLHQLYIHHYIVHPSNDTDNQRDLLLTRKWDSEISTHVMHGGQML